MAGPRDERAHVQTFTSQEERDHWQIRQYGHVRNGFRTEDEAPDGRPLLYHPEPFWADETERLEYEHAVESRPQSQEEGGLAYIMRLAGLVSGRYKQAGRVMPSGLSRRARDRRQRELDRQAQAMRRADVRLPYADDAA